MMITNHNVLAYDLLHAIFRYIKIRNHHKMAKYKGRDVKELRSRLSISQDELSDIIDVSVHTIRHWEQKSDADVMTKYESKLLPLIEDKLSIVNEENVKSNFFDKLKSNMGNITFIREAVIMYYCAIDPSTNKFAKTIAIAALVYFINPIDIFPDFIPFTGFLDDAAMVTGAIASMRSSIKDEHEKKADKWLNSVK